MWYTLRKYDRTDRAQLLPIMVQTPITSFLSSQYTESRTTCSTPLSICNSRPTVAVTDSGMYLNTNPQPDLQLGQNAACSNTMVSSDNQPSEQYVEAAASKATQKCHPQKAVPSKTGGKRGPKKKILNLKKTGKNGKRITKSQKTARHVRQAWR